MERIYEYTIKLIRYVLNGDVPELPTDIDFEKLFTFGKSHDIENMLYVGLRDLNIPVPEDTMQKFEKSYKMAIMIEAKQAFELEAISEEFEKAGIDHIPLKGSVIKHLYPMPDYRKSGDIDILIKPEDEGRINSVMLKLGYERDKNYNTHEIHFSYKKPPFIEVEVHRRLTSRTARANKFCEKVWNYASLHEGKEHLYSLSNEYHYMFLIAHLCRHLYLGGAGIKLFTDIYVMSKTCSMDNNLIDKYIRKANLTDIHNMVLDLVKKWFKTGYTLSSNVEILENIVFTNGSFGTYEMHKAMIANNTETDKVKKYIQKMFPPARILKGRYSFLERKPYLLPIMWIYRFFDIGLFERDTIAKKTKTVFGEAEKNIEIQSIVKAVRDR